LAEQKHQSALHGSLCLVPGFSNTLASITFVLVGLPGGRKGLSLLPVRFSRASVNNRSRFPLSKGPIQQLLPVGPVHGIVRGAYEGMLLLELVPTDQSLCLSYVFGSFLTSRCLSFTIFVPPSGRRKVLAYYGQFVRREVHHLLLNRVSALICRSDLVGGSGDESFG
jgi:hypothetical protein